jgi:hypothetical protein
MPPYAVFTYRGAEADLREVPLGTEFEFLLLPDEDGNLTRLAGTRHGGALDETQQQRFVEFTQARGLAGWIDRTEGKRVTVTFFSGTPDRFDANWGDAFAKGQGVTVCVANDELRTWQPTSCGEKGTIVEHASVPVEGYGSSGRRVVIEVNNMLEGFRRGRIVRVFGAGWKVRNQLFQECLINYGYSQRPPPDFRECLAKHYPEHFPYRTDFGNRHLPWFRAAAGSPPPMHSEHLMLGDLTALDPATGSGEFKTEGTGEPVKFTMLDTGSRTPALRYRTDSFEGRSRTAELPLGRRYRFLMYQDEQGVFNRCSQISDDYSNAAVNSLNYQIQRLDPESGECEVTWQALPVGNYQKDTEIPPPYGRSVVRLTAETRVWKALDPMAEKMKAEKQKVEKQRAEKQKPAKFTDEQLNAQRQRLEKLKADMKAGRLSETEFKKLKQEIVAAVQAAPAASIASKTGEPPAADAGTALTLNDLKVGDLIKFNVTSEFPGRPSHCTDVWIVELPAGRSR